MPTADGLEVPIVVTVRSSKITFALLVPLGDENAPRTARSLTVLLALPQVDEEQIWIMFVMLSVGLSPPLTFRTTFPWVWIVFPTAGTKDPTRNPSMNPSKCRSSKVLLGEFSKIPAVPVPPLAPAPGQVQVIP
jgi:hypothetical protein